MPVTLASTLQRAWLARGPLAWSLRPLSWLYGAVADRQRARFQSGRRQSERVGVPVIVVGNLIAGGAGKTPTCIAVVELLRRHGWTPGIVSRGYGRRDDATVLQVSRTTPASTCGDEPLLLHLRTRAPVVVGRDRVAAARELIARQPSTNVIVCDDGLQHLRLARDAQVIVFDERGAGNGWLLPAGPLREPLPTAVPPRSVLLYNATSPSTPLPGHVVMRGLSGFVSLKDWWSGRAAKVDLRGRPLLAAAGLAHPQRFFRMLRDQGLQVRELPLPDHHDFAALPWPADTPDVVLTEKDAVKLDPDRPGRTRVWVAALDFQLPAAFEAELLALLPARPGRAAAPT